MRGRPHHFDDLSGGVNLRDAAYLLDSKQARDLLNMVSRSRGAVSRRDGSTQFASVAAAGIFPVESLASPKLITSRAGAIEALDSAGAVAATQAGTFGTMEWVGAPANGGQGPVYGMDGVVARYYDGAAFGTWTASTGTLPLGKYLIAQGNRVLIAGPDSKVSASDIGNPRDWDTSDGGAWAVQLEPADGEGLTGIGAVGADVLVFKRDKVFVIYDLDTGANRRVSHGTGCSAHRSISESPYGTFFLAEDGVWVTDGNRLDRVSKNIDPLLESIVPAARWKAAGAWFNDRYYLSICTTGSENNLTLEYDPVNKAWWIHSLAAAQWSPWTQSAGSPATLFGCHPTPAWVFRAFVEGATADGAEEFLAYWKSAWHSFGSPYRRKRCRMAHFDGEGAMNVYASTDFSEADTLIGAVDFAASSGLFGGAGVFGGEGIFGGDPGVDESRALTPGVGRVWSLVVSSASPFTVDSYTLLMTDRKD